MAPKQKSTQQNFFAEMERAQRVADEVARAVKIPNIEEALVNALGAKKGERAVKDALLAALREDEVVDILKETVREAVGDTLRDLLKETLEEMLQDAKATLVRMPR